MMSAVNARIKIHPVEGLLGLHRYSEDRQARINTCGFYARLISEYVMLIIGEFSQ